MYFRSGNYDVAVIGAGHAGCEAALARNPLPRLGRPEDIGDAIVFLASDRAGYITGETLHVTGGRYSS